MAGLDGLDQLAGAQSLALWSIAGDGSTSVERHYDAASNRLFGGHTVHALGGVCWAAKRGIGGRLPFVEECAGTMCVPPGCVWCRCLADRRGKCVASCVFEVGGEAARRLNNLADDR